MAVTVPEPARTFVPPTYESVADERQHRKVRLAAGFRLFSKAGFDEASPATSPPATRSSPTPSG